MKKRYKKPNEKSFFDEENRRKALSEVLHPLKRLQSAINFEIFRTDLEKAFKNTPRGPGGRPAFDLVLMFKVLIIQRTYDLSDARTQFAINDSLSMQDFLGLTLADSAPDEKTIWAFRECLRVAGVERLLFDHFDKGLLDSGMILNKGSIVDASFVEVPVQRNNRKENQTIKKGGIPKDWTKPENANKLAQKDVDARWTKKNDVAYYGYKDHVKVDAGSKLITEYSVTDASVHDSQEIGNLLDENDSGKPCYADSAYVGNPIAAIMEDLEIKGQVNEKGYRGKPLTKTQMKANRIKSKIRARVEHVFGFIENSLGGSTLRSIGMGRAKFGIGMMNLVYNLFRAEQIIRLRLVT
ncbi:MAG: IS5 family transposase [Cyanobacteriota bacterium]|jgi:IS5 family transposase